LLFVHGWDESSLCEGSSELFVDSSAINALKLQLPRLSIDLWL
jgi:hypothetical protein